MFAGFFPVREYSLTKKRLRLGVVDSHVQEIGVREYSLTKKRLRPFLALFLPRRSELRPGVFADEEAIETSGDGCHLSSKCRVREYSLTKKRLRLGCQSGKNEVVENVREYSLTKKRLRLSCGVVRANLPVSRPGVFADEEAIETPPRARRSKASAFVREYSLTKKRLRRPPRRHVGAGDVVSGSIR